MENDQLSEKVVDSKRVWNGSFLAIDVLDVILPNGKPTTRDVVRHPGAVAIIALDLDNRVLLVHQYRAALERITREIPAGKLDHGEDAIACALRELEEETGYHANSIRYLAPIAVAAGYSDEVIHLFLATDLERGSLCPDADEFVASEWVALEDLIDDVLDSKVEDAKTVIAALLCDAISRRLP